MILQIFLLFAAICQVFCGPTIHTYNSTNCDGFQATFDINKVVGMWQVVAIIPEKLFPERDVNCYRVEFRETDGAGLSWLINKKHPPKNASYTPIDVHIEGTAVRQRYHTDHAFDVWSKSVKGVNGCFQQVLSLDVNANDTITETPHTQKPIDPQTRGFGCRRHAFGFRRHSAAAACRFMPRELGFANKAIDTEGYAKEALKHDAMMQLHIIETGDSEPFLVQMLWGRLISVVIYKRTQGVTQDQLKPVFEAVSKLRGPQRLPKICENPLRDLLFKD